MALQRHYFDKLMLSLFDKEATYNAGPVGYAAAQACSMIDFDEASAHADWDDTLQTDTDVVTGKELISIQQIVRESVRLAYTEPRVKPNTLAGLLGLCLGTVVSTQDGILIAFRHKITKAASVSLPSIGAQIKHEAGDQRELKGLKAESATLSINGGYWSLGTQMIGSGARATSSTAFPASISENWLLLGDAKIFLKDTGGAAITVPATPAQGSANLGGAEVDFSPYIRTSSVTWTNNLAVEAGYRASTGKLRANFHPVRRAGTISVGFDVDTTKEAADLDYYLLQKKLALEININSGVVIAGGGLFKFGLILIVPSFQLTRVPRSQTEDFEIVTFEGAIRDDGTNSELVAFVFNSQAAYLA